MEILNIHISNGSSKPIYEQIAGQLKQAILSGELPAGAPLPSMRLLAKELRISVITTKRAYEELEKEGFLHSVVGKGSYVADTSRELIREEQFRKIETYLEQAVNIAEQTGIGRVEILEILEMLYKEE